MKFVICCGVYAVISASGVNVVVRYFIVSVFPFFFSRYIVVGIVNAIGYVLYAVAVNSDMADRYVCSVVIRYRDSIVKSVGIESYCPHIAVIVIVIGFR